MRACPILSPAHEPATVSCPTAQAEVNIKLQSCQSTLSSLKDSQYGCLDFTHHHVSGESDLCSWLNTMQSDYGALRSARSSGVRGPRNQQPACEEALLREGPPSTPLFTGMFRLLTRRCEAHPQFWVHVTPDEAAQSRKGTLPALQHLPVRLTPLGGLLRERPPLLLCFRTPQPAPWPLQSVNPSPPAPQQTVHPGLSVQSWLPEPHCKTNGKSIVSVIPSKHLR